MLRTYSTKLRFCKYFKGIIKTIEVISQPIELAQKVVFKISKVFELCVASNWTIGKRKNIFQITTKKHRLRNWTPLPPPKECKEWWTVCISDLNKLNWTRRLDSRFEPIFATASKNNAHFKSDQNWNENNHLPVHTRV